MSSGLERILQRHCSALPVDVAAMALICETIVAQPDTTSGALSDLRQLAHTMAGTSGSLGYPKIGETAREIEKLASEQIAAEHPSDGVVVGQLRGLVGELADLVAGLAPHRSTLWNGALHEASNTPERTFA